MAKSIDSSKEQIAEVKEALETLWALGEAKQEIFRLTINDRLKNAAHTKTLPITAIVNQAGDIRAYVSKDIESIETIIRNIAGIFISGKAEVASAIANIATTVIRGFLGSGKGSETQCEKYAAYTDGIALLRFDMYGWRSDVNAKSLMDRVESVSAYYYTVSVVDIHEIDFPTFAAAYQNVLQQTLPPPSHEAILKMLKELKEIYDTLRIKSKDEYVKYIQKAYPSLKMIK